MVQHVLLCLHLPKSCFREKKKSFNLQPSFVRKNDVMVCLYQKPQMVEMIGLLPCVGLPTEMLVKHPEWSPGWDALAHSVPLPLPVFYPTSKVTFRFLSSSTTFLPSRWEIFLPLNISSSDFELKRRFLIAGWLYDSGDLWRSLDTFIFLIYFLTGENLLYSVGFCSTMRNSQNYIYINICIPTLLSLSPLPTVHRFRPTQSTKAGLLMLYSGFLPAVYFIQDSAHMSALLSPFFPPSPSPALTPSPSSTSLSPFFPCIQVPQYHFSDSICMY